MKLGFMTEYPQLRPLMLAVFTDVLGYTIIFAFLPVIASQFTSDPFLIGLLIGCNAIFGLFSSIIFGKLSDLHGRKPWILIPLIGTAGGFLILSFATSLAWVFVARIVDGVFSGIIAVGKAVVGDIVVPKDRGKQMTNIGTAMTMGAVFGPSIGGFLFESFGIFGVGIVATLVSAVNSIYVWLRLPETHPKKKLVKNVDQKIELGKEKHADHKRGNSPWILRNKRAVYILVVTAILVLGAFIFESTMSLFLYNQHGFTTAEIGIVLSLIALFQISFRLLAFPSLHAKWGDLKSYLMGVLIYMTGYLLLSIVGGFWGILAVMCYLCLGAALSRGIIVGFASRVVDASVQGRMMGITSALDSVGQILGPFIGTFLLLDLSGLAYTLTLAGMAGVTLLMSFRLSTFNFEVKRGENRS